LVAVIVLAASLLSSGFFVARRKWIKKTTLPHLSQGKIAAITIISVVLAEIAFIVLSFLCCWFEFRPD